MMTLELEYYGRFANRASAGPEDLTEGAAELLHAACCGTFLGIASYTEVMEKRLFTERVNERLEEISEPSAALPSH